MKAIKILAVLALVMFVVEVLGDAATGFMREREDYQEQVEKREHEHRKETCTLQLKAVRGEQAVDSIHNKSGQMFLPYTVESITIENVTLLSLLICGVLMILMMRNVSRKQVFIQQNANLIAGIGFSLEVNGLVLMTLHYLSPASSDGSQQYLIFMLIGVFFLFINCLFKLGIQMQEEQDLTV